MNTTVLLVWTKFSLLTRLTPSGLNTNHLIRLITEHRFSFLLIHTHIVTHKSLLLWRLLALTEGAALSIFNHTTQYSSNLPQTPPTAQSRLISHKKEEPDGHEQLQGGPRMSACMEMPGVSATVYLVLRVTTVNLVERLVCGWAHFQG